MLYNRYPRMAIFGPPLWKHDVWLHHGKSSTRDNFRGVGLKRFWMFHAFVEDSV